MQGLLLAEAPVDQAALPPSVTPLALSATLILTSRSTATGRKCIVGGGLQHYVDKVLVRLSKGQVSGGQLPVKGGAAPMGACGRLVRSHVTAEVE